jgi:DNA-binding NarL/FixJ family response regulator
VDDHSLFRSGVARLLMEFNDLVVDFEAANGKELQKKLPAFQLITEVILMDITMPGMDGFSSTLWVKETYPHIHVIALSMYEEENVIIKMLKAGAGGYIFKESKPMDLHRAISQVKQKGYYNDDLVTGKLIKSLNRKDESPAVITLTEREKEFLIFCPTEYTYKEIALKMNVATRTVDNYRESLFEKLNIKSRVGLALFAIKNDFVKL